MANPELIRVMDYILNRCDEKDIEAVAAAVVRRRRDLTMFGGAQKLPDPRKMAQDLSAQINIGANIDGLKDTIRNMAVRIIRQEAPELTDSQVDELTRAWVPAKKNAGAENSGGEAGGNKQLPPDVLESMIDQFTAYSQGRMPAGEDANLRTEIGSWPERYWNAFPPVIRSLISDFLKGELPEEEFNAKIKTACAL
jgi:hypothetical protein